MTDTVTPPAATPPGGDPGEGARWRGYSHKELYQMLHEGPGAAASASPSRRWAEISTTLIEISQDLGKALDLTGSGWQGRAAGAAYDRLSTTVRWADDAGTGAGIMRTAVEDQGDHIAKARADMPVPEGVTPATPDPTVAPAVQVLQTQDDAEPAEAAASAAAERAVEVMTAYETNTKATTASFAAFDVPEPLLPSTGLHQGHGGGLLGILPTVPANIGGGGPPQHHHHQPHHHDDWRHPRDNWYSPGTGSSGAGWEETRRPGSPVGIPAPAPGKTTGVSLGPLLAPPAGSGAQDRSASRGGNNAANNAPGSGSGQGSAAAPPKPGTTNMALPPSELQQAQAAAASQAAAGAHPGAGAPIAPTTGVGAAGHDKVGLRRFGMEAIGSSQWFGDTEEPVVGQSQKRRFDLRDSAEVTESVSILDEEHKLPPTVIGEGGR